VKSLLRLRQSLTVVAVMVLAACNAAQSVSPNVGAGSNARLGATGIVSNHGGRFRATYSGTYSRLGDCSDTATFTYQGNGTARFLHSSSEQIKLTWYCGSENATGTATLTNVQVPRDTVTASLSSTDFTGPCDGSTVSFTVTGGTGRFRRASGSGEIALRKLSSRYDCYSYRDKWRGTLNF
jgi:hypothetical protein